MPCPERYPQAIAGTTISVPPTAPPSSPATTQCRRLAEITVTASTTPKTNCDTTNHGQSISSRTVGSTMLVATKLTAVQASGINSAAQASGRAIGGSVGNSTPYSRPNVSDVVA